MNRMIFAALLCSTALASPADAGPVVSFVLGAVGAAFTGPVVGAYLTGVGFAGTLVGGVLLKLGASLALSAISARLNRPRVPTPADRMRNYAQERPPMDRVYGQARKGGPMGFTGYKTAVFQQTPGGLVSKSRATRYNVILLAAHPTDGVVQWFLDSRETSVNAVGEIATAPMVGFGALRLYTGQVGQAADPVLRAVFPEITAGHDFAGLSYVVLEARKASATEYTEVYPSGYEWAVAPVIRGHNQIYDPRTMTYGYSNNAALIIAHEATTMFAKTVDWAEVAEEAEVCDQLVTNADGASQRRWTINLVLDDTMTWETVRDQLGLTCGAWFYQRADGKMGFKAGRWIEPSLTLTDRDFLSVICGDQQWGPDVPGEFVVSYVEPSRQWREAPTGAYIVEAGRARHSEEVYGIDSHNQAARVAKLMSRAMRPRFVVSGVVKLIGYEMIGQRFVRINSATLGRNIVVEITKFERNSDGVTFSFEGRSADASDYVFDAATEEPAQPVNLPVQNDDAIVPVAGFAGSVVEGTGGVAQIEWRWTLPDDSSLRQELRTRSIPAGMAEWQSIIVGEGAASFLAAPLVDGQPYEAQVRNRSASGRVSEWSSVVVVYAVANTVPPAALMAFGAAATGGGADITFTAPNDPVYSATRIFRGPTTDFADAAAVQVENGAPNLADTWLDAGLAAGTYSYWAEPINASGIAGARSGPETITII